MQYPCGWVSPFGHCRIKAYCQLPDTFRRLSRPSSPLTAKASTVCAYSLDHITPSCLGTTCRIANGYDLSLDKDGLRHLASASTRCKTCVSNARLTLLPDCQRTCHGLNAWAFQSVCAQSFRVGLSPRSRLFSGARRGDAKWAYAHEHRRNAAPGKSGGSGRTRTTGLTLIRGAL